MSDPTVSSTQHLIAIISRVKFLPSCVNFDWKWEYEAVFGPNQNLKGWLVNTTFVRPDTNTGEMGVGKGRKEFIAVESTESSVIKTCFLLARLITDHEIMESFTVDEVKVFDPHHSIDDLKAAQTHRKGENTSNSDPWLELEAVLTKHGFQIDADAMRDRISDNADTDEWPWYQNSIAFDPQHHEQIDALRVRIKEVYTNTNWEDNKWQCPNCDLLFDDEETREDCSHCMGCHQALHLESEDGDCVGEDPPEEPEKENDKGADKETANDE